jgi:hypothetical protein
MLVSYVLLVYLDQKVSIRYIRRLLHVDMYLKNFAQV